MVQAKSRICQIVPCPEYKRKKCGKRENEKRKEEENGWKENTGDMHEKSEEFDN